MATKREEMIAWLKDNNITYTEISCDDCADVDSCKWAFDTYNTDGDCLGVK